MLRLEEVKPFTFNTEEPPMNIESIGVDELRIARHDHNLVRVSFTCRLRAESGALEEVALSVLLEDTDELTLAEITEAAGVRAREIIDRLLKDHGRKT